MPYNRPGNGVYVTNAGSAFAHGTPRKEQGFVGVAVKQVAGDPTTALATQKQIAGSEAYFLITKGVVQVDNVSGFAKGDPVYITSGNVLTETSAGNTKFGVVVTIPGEKGTPTGKCRIDLDAKDSF